MGKVVSSVGKALGLSGGGGAGPKLNEDKFNVAPQVQTQVAPARDASLALIRQLQGSAAGTGPSIAENQLKSTTNRNLAQTMALAAASRGGNPAAAQRQLLQQRAASNRDVAEQGATLRLQEAQQAQNTLSGLTQSQQQNDLNQIMQPAQLSAQGEQARFGADVARVQSTKDAQNAMMGSILSGASQVGAAAAGKAPAAKVAAHGDLVEGPEVVEGDSEANDVVPYNLSAGELVIPKTVVSQGPAAISKFAAAILKSQQGQEKPKAAGYASVLAAKKSKKAE